MSDIRIGHGYDVHAFGDGDKIVIGGAVIPHAHGLIAHSDGDVLLHALCDALLGAAALGISAQTAATIAAVAPPARFGCRTDPRNGRAASAPGPRPRCPAIRS